MTPLYASSAEGFLHRHRLPCPAFAVGERAADAILSLRTDDGADLPESYRPRANPGVYVPTTIPAAPQWPASQAMDHDQRRSIPPGTAP
jgi:hypothetical protein